MVNVLNNKKKAVYAGQMDRDCGEPFARHFSVLNLAMQRARHRGQSETCGHRLCVAVLIHPGAVLLIA